MKRWSQILVALIFAGGLAFRWTDLGVRPMHADEAVNAFTATELWEHGRYVYNPDEHHGPTLHYATLPFLWFNPARTAAELDDRVLRLAPVVFGAGLILLLFLFRDALGDGATIWAALFTAISPAMVFYSRYFIHEMLLVFFGVLLLGSGWRYWRSRQRGWAVTAGAALGLMFATKETFVIQVGCMVLAAVATRWQIRRHGTNAPDETTNRGCVTRDIVWAGVAAVVTWAVFFSAFFNHVEGIIDSVRTYLPWMRRAAGDSPHLHPWTFYLERLIWFHGRNGPVWSEALIVGLALIGGVVAFSQKSWPLRFLVFYTVTLTAIYSAIAYKTPWCLLGFWHGFIVLAGVGGASIVERTRARWMKAGILLILGGLTGQLAFQAWEASYVYASDRSNPYVYAQTGQDLSNMVERLKTLTRASAGEPETVVKVMAPRGDYWPLPWSLRSLKNVGWYDAVPEDPFAPVMIVSSQFGAKLDDRSGGKWIMVGLTEMRPGRFFELYVELELWKRFLDKRTIQ